MRRDFPWRVLFYGFYGILLVVLLLYVRFPEERLRQFCENSLQRYVPAWDAQIEAIGYNLPATLVFKHVRLTGTFDRRPSELVVERISLTLNLRHLSALTLNADLYGGTLTAFFTLNRQESKFHLEEIQVEGLSLDKVLDSLGMIEREVTGKFGFWGNYQATWEAPLKGQGQGWLEVTSGRMGLLAPVLSLSSIDFDRLTAEVDFHGEKVQLAGVELRGKELSADFSGMVMLVYPLPESELVLNGMLRPEAGYLQANPREQMLVQRLQQRYNTSALPFKVAGTLSGPTFRFGRTE